MTTPLPPYSGENPTCPKCSNVGAYTEWKGADRIGGVPIREERLKRRCERCDFAWPEALNPPTTKDTRA